jgi:hypothetical protein
MSTWYWDNGHVHAGTSTNVTSGYIRADAGDAPNGTPYKAGDGLWRVDNVPICSTGIEYRLGTGPHTFTAQDLADAVQAASGSDVAINAPRVKLGHTSKANDLFLGEDEPAFGRVTALRLSENGQTIYGDFVGMPEWLAKVMPVAFPSRSVDAQLHVETVTGKRYGMVITDVSLLGVRWPGCSVLEDLPLWYGSETPESAEVLAASLDVTAIRNKFYVAGPGKEHDAWWIRGERFDTEEGYNLIVDEGTGDICRVAVRVDGDEVKFGEPVRVTEQYPDKTVAASAVLAGMKMADPAMLIHANRAETDRSTNQEGEAMDEELRRSLAKRLGLPEDATEEQIRSELAKPVGEEQPPPAEGDDQPDQDNGGNGAEEPDEGAEEEQPAIQGDPVSATVSLDRATYNQLKRGAELAASHERERQAGRITEMVEAAVKDGRIPPARREHWTKLAKADFDGTKTTLDSLERGLVPVTVRGNAGTGGDEGVQTEQTQGLPEEWFPEIKAIRAQANRDRRVVNAKEG